MTDTAKPQTDRQAEGKKKQIPTWVWIVAGILVIGLIGQAFGGNDEEPGSATSDETVVAPEEETSDDPRVDSAEEEAAEPEPEPVPESFSSIEEMEAALHAELGEETNMGLPRELSVEFDETDGWLNVSFVINENFTTDSTRRGAWREIGQTFEFARKVDFVNELTVTAKFPLISELGAELGPQDVVLAYFDPEVYPRINVENLPGDRLGDAATAVQVHPALQ